MKTIYFIDNESIKRTAKAIQKNNPTFKYTVILDDLSQLLGYESYNQYEHYLTNALLSNNSGLNHIQPLTKINSIELLLMKNEFLAQLSKKNYSIDNLYFINKIIDNQIQGFIEHSQLDLRSYIYYLPLIFKDINTINENDINLIKKNQLQNIIKVVMDEYNSVDFESIHTLILNLKKSEDYTTDESLYTQFNHLHNNLKTRGIYYYIKSVLEDFEYDEGILTKLILNGYSIEKIEHEINLRIRKLYSIQIPVFFKKDKNMFIHEYFPFIRSSITEQKPLVFGKSLDNLPVFADVQHFRSNISFLGVPGSGRSLFLYNFVFQMVMNNRGFCLIGMIDKPYMENYIRAMADSLNKKDVIFMFNRDSNISSIASAAHNDKIILTNCANLSDARRKGIDVEQAATDRFESIVKGLTDQFFNQKFRSKKIPFYVILEDAEYLRTISKEAQSMIKKLNNLNIFFIFSNQIYESYISELCATHIVSNSSLKYFQKSSNFEFCEVIKGIDKNPSIIGKEGPSKSLPPVFSVIYKNLYIDQFITEFDETLFEIERTKT